MNTIKVQASLRRGLREDIFTPRNTQVPQQSEQIRDNNVVFLWCPVRGRFVGVETFWSHQDTAEALVPLDCGMLYVFKEKMDFVKDDIVLEVFLDLAAAEDLKENSWLLKFGLVYFIHQDDDTVSGPHFLSPSTDILKIKEYLESKKIYLVAKQQSFREIQTKKTA